MSQNTNFNEAQNRAISFETGSVLVLSGPGSGKTTVLVHRVMALLEKGLAKPEEIIVLTFTRAAAEEMRTRFAALTQNRYPGVFFGTFHSFFWRLLRMTFGMQPDQLLADADRKKILEQILKRPVGDRECTDLLYVLGRLRAADRGNRRRLLQEEPELEFLFTAYEEAKRQLQKVEYEDLAPLLCGKLHSFPVIRQKIRQQYRFWLVDEAQDMNAEQYKTLLELAGAGANLFLVGDDAQSLYGFRGSEPKLLRRFQRTCHARILRLEINYRSCSAIVVTAERLIVHNRGQKQRCIRPAREDTGIVRLTTCSIRQEEAEQILRIIRNAQRQGTPLCEIAILVRSRQHLVHIRRELEASELPAEQIQMTTYHGAKGLEYDLVILPQLNEGCVPDPRATTLEALEEERRMLYVAVTRARKQLELLAIEQSSGKWRRLSRFLPEMGVEMNRECEMFNVDKIW